MSLNFTAIDFETANPQRGSVCQVGLAKVRNGRTVDTAGWLIRPPDPFNWFYSFNTQLHGVGPDDVADAPGWPESLSQITQFIDDDVAVAHNAAFDLSVLRQACIAEGIHWPSMDFLCTLLAARHTFDLPSYRLPFVLQACGVTLVSHHHATADAWAAASVMTAMATRANAGSITAFADNTQLRLGHIETGFYAATRWKRPGHGLITPDTDPDADPDGPLFGKVIVFTGALACMSRQVAWEQVGLAGGFAQPNVTKRTQVLVAGDLNPATFAPDAMTTNKVRRAFELQEGGQDLEVMTEGDFVRSLTPAGTKAGDQFDMRLLLSDDTLATDPTPEGSPFYLALNHAQGRATGGESCVVCSNRIASSAAWVWRDRHICSEHCNVMAKRWYKRWVAKGHPPGGWLRRR